MVEKYPEASRAVVQAAMEAPGEFAEIESIDLRDSMMEALDSVYGKVFWMARACGWMIQVVLERRDNPDGSHRVYSVPASVPPSLHRPGGVTRGETFYLAFIFNDNGTACGSYGAVVPVLASDDSAAIPVAFEEACDEFLVMPFKVPSKLTRTDTRLACLSYVFERHLLPSVCNSGLRAFHEEGGMMMLRVDLQSLDAMLEGESVLDFVTCQGWPLETHKIMSGDLSSRIIPGHTFGVFVCVHDGRDDTSLWSMRMTFPRDVSAHPDFAKGVVTSPVCLDKDEMRVKGRFIQTRCFHCHATAVKLKVCSGCMVVRYCSLACAKTHWCQHKRECKTIQALYNNPPAMACSYVVRQ